MPPQGTATVHEPVVTPPAGSVAGDAPSASGVDPVPAGAAPAVVIPAADAPEASQPAHARERSAATAASPMAPTPAFPSALAAAPLAPEDALRAVGSATGTSAPHTVAATTDMPATPATPAPPAPSGVGFSGSFGSSGTGFLFAVLLAFCLAPCLRYGKVALIPARWRPVLFVSLLERPG